MKCSTMCIEKIKEIRVVGVKNIEALPFKTVQLGVN